MKAVSRGHTIVPSAEPAPSVSTWSKPRATKVPVLHFEVAVLALLVGKVVQGLYGDGRAAVRAQGVLESPIVGDHSHRDRFQPAVLPAGRCRGDHADQCTSAEETGPRQARPGRSVRR